MVRTINPSTWSVRLDSGVIEGTVEYRRRQGIVRGDRGMLERILEYCIIKWSTREKSGMLD